MFPVAIDKRPTAAELLPVDLAASPIATLILLAFAPLPPPIAIEKSAQLTSAFPFETEPDPTEPF
ncbi:hypothetical protein [Bradyrhizobium brasilense]|uniref:hypothetical protein n=1 Tax=Bradyrhizobium brasilense TaxID=1419277 RepID=UPI001F1C5D54|nr:hypothetical protein [Bradyrhizobium brasilense]